MEWHVYILLCADGSYYVGHTDDLDARVKTHNLGRAAAHTCLRRPVVLAYAEPADSRIAAAKREKQIKRWSRAKKAALIRGDSQALKQLSSCRTR
jgi:predicted GIY-YIG superfamily endonuclease